MRKNEWNYLRWMEICTILLAVIMVFFGYKEYCLQEQMEYNIKCEQIAAKQKSPVHVQDYEDEQLDDNGQESQQETGKMIRVLLMDNNQNSCMQQQVILQSSGDITVTGAKSCMIAPDTPIDVSTFLDVGEVVSVESDTPITVLSLERSQGTPSYEGKLEIHRNENGYYIVNEMELETYLKYVVPSEMPASYPQEALKAQAVCARTYAVRQIQSDSLEEYGADVNDTVAYQVYNNISRQESTDQAVEETRGEIMCCNGEPIQAYFFSTSCGFTSSDDVWSDIGEAEYLRSISVSRQTVETLANSGNSEPTVPQLNMSNEEFEKTICEKNSLDYECEEPWYRWEVNISWEEIEKRAEIKFPGIGKLQKIEIGDRSSGGAAIQLILTGSGKEEVIENEYRIREFLSPGKETVKLQDGTGNTSMQLLPSAYMVIETIMENQKPSALHIRGGGYGHGVGMSQNGAKHLAMDGLEWQQILSVFYKNYTLQNELLEQQDSQSHTK
ncbi:MAG: SpoIID/LytB domain-containing protein [Oliverpabstia sp.]